MSFKIKVPDLGIIDQIKRHVDAILLGIEEIVRANRITIKYPRERRKYPENFRGLIKYDPTKCICCFQCAFVCPANAIKMKMAPNGKYYVCIDYTKCIFCHFCVDSCQKNALESTTLHEIVSKSLDDLLITTEKLVEKPETLVEERNVIEFVERNGNTKINKL